MQAESHNTPDRSTTSSNRYPAYKEQLTFHYHHHGSSQPVDKFATRALRRCMRSARRICRTNRGLRIIAVGLSHSASDLEDTGAASSVLDPFAEEPDPEVMTAVRKSFKESRVLLVAKPLAKQFAHVDPISPGIIYIDSATVTRLSKHVQKFGIDGQATEETMAEVVITICHEWQHALRLQMPLVPNDTPPRLRPSADALLAWQPVATLARETVSPSEASKLGEGGWWFDEQMFGGKVVRDERLDFRKQRAVIFTTGLVIMRFSSGPESYWKWLRGHVIKVLLTGEGSALEACFPLLGKDDEHERIHTAPPSTLRHREMSTPTQAKTSSLRAEDSDSDSDWEPIPDTEVMFKSRSCGRRALVNMQEVSHDRNDGSVIRDMGSSSQTYVQHVEIPFSILDTDLYKLSMQNAVLRWFPEARVVIRFTNRSPHMLFSKQSFAWIQEHMLRLSTLRLTPEERDALRDTCPYFPGLYISYLEALRLEPEKQVELGFIPKNEDGTMGEITCVIRGLWKEVILYEVPIMSIMSEAYFRFVDTDWNYDGQFEQAKDKARRLLSPPAPTQPIIFSEFGTRRRRSFMAQDVVIRGLLEGVREWRAAGGQGPGLAGTSNVYLALKYGLQPVGTIAHEWIMGIGAVHGYPGSNGRAMDMWEAVYPRGPDAAPLTMLTDTYTAQAFFVDFKSDLPRALRWTTLRQDSGDPFVFVKQAKEVWGEVEEAAGLSEEEKSKRVRRVIFSDGLDVDRAIKLQQGCDDIGIGASFGIGTFLTNDFRKASDPGQVSKPLNIVIKLNEIEGKPCVKLSDDKGKYTGNVDEVKRVQDELHLPREHEDKRRG